MKKIKKNTKKKAWRRLSTVMNRVGRRHEAIDEADIERDVLDAIQAVRKETDQREYPIRSQK